MRPRRTPSDTRRRSRRPASIRGGHRHPRWAHRPLAPRDEERDRQCPARFPAHRGPPALPRRGQTGGPRTHHRGSRLPRHSLIRARRVGPATALRPEQGPATAPASAPASAPPSAPDRGPAPLPTPYPTPDRIRSRASARVRVQARTPPTRRLRSCPRPTSSGHLQTATSSPVSSHSDPRPCPASLPMSAPRVRTRNRPCDLTASGVRSLPPSRTDRAAAPSEDTEGPVPNRCRERSFWSAWARPRAKAPPPPPPASTRHAASRSPALHPATNPLRTVQHPCPTSRRPTTFPLPNTPAQLYHEAGRRLPRAAPPNPGPPHGLSHRHHPPSKAVPAGQ